MVERSLSNLNKIKMRGKSDEEKAKV
jgi:hypothetical protein